MLRSKRIDRVCCVVLACTLVLTVVFTALAANGTIRSNRTAIGYENRIFDQSVVHTLDIVMNDWEGFLSTCTNEEYAACAVVIDGEKIGSVAIRAKGNTSLSSVAAYGNNRYSFKIEFDQYEKGKSYHGLDKLSLNNIIQDATYMKDYLSYTLMGKMGVAAPLCSYVQINVNGEPWGLYLAVEAVEDSFLRRNYGIDSGELYKPDSLSFGGGRGNGRDFDMDDFRERMSDESDGAQTETPDATTGATAAAAPDSAATTPDAAATTPGGGDFAPSFGGSSGASASGNMPDFGDLSGFGAPPDMSDMPDLSGMPDVSGMFGGGGFGGFGMGSGDVKLQYIDDDPASYENIFSGAKTDITESDKTRLIASLKKLSEGDTSAIDADSVAMYMAVQNFLCNDDSYTGMMIHNYYLYEDDGVMSMIPWDYNLAFGGFSGGMNGATGAVNTAIDDLVSSGSASDRPMAGWIAASDESLSLYHEKYRAFMDDAFASGWFAEEFDRVRALISPYVESDATAFYPYDEFETAADTLKTFCLKRAQSVQAQLDGAIPATSAERTDGDALIDASELTLSDMGGMNTGNGGMGGGKGGMGDRSGGRGFTARSSAKERPSATPDASASPETSVMPDASASPETNVTPETSMMPDASASPTASPDAAIPNLPAGTMPNGAPPTGTENLPAGTMPYGAPPTGTENLPAGTMPNGTPPTGTGNLPAGTMPNGTPPTGTDFTGSAGSSGGQSSSEQTSDPATTASVSDASTAPSTDAPYRGTQESARNDRARQSILLCVSVVVLLAAILIAKFFKHHV